MQDFTSAVSDGDGARACGLLTEQARENADCAALGVPGGPVEQVEVRGGRAVTQRGMFHAYLVGVSVLLVCFGVIGLVGM
ncbi:hypothetical protein [Saccharothrix algeriensis]|uniref:Uncharacterized protein n=1 Tax=Saccharothrix algeriensis TaxID=173560 RepID=A0ABS2SEA8_9PSEU|nr:hypothetical protein [Saccharothrix algeriensis]MBM7814610.1 hypothetical protein [Saccharothrix algeriensis]